MIRVLSGFDAIAIQSSSANGAKGSKDSENVFNSLIGQFEKGKAGTLPQQTSQGTFKDGVEGKAGPGQVIQFFEAAGKDGPQAALSFLNSDSPEEPLFQGVADGLINTQTAAGFFAGVEFASVKQGGGPQITDFEASGSQPGQLFLDLSQGVAGGAISARATTQSIRAMGPASGAQFESYVVGNSLSGEFPQTVQQGVSGEQGGADASVELVAAVTPADQTPG